MPDLNCVGKLSQTPDEVLAFYQLLFMAVASLDPNLEIERYIMRQLLLLVLVLHMCDVCLDHSLDLRR